MVWWITCSIITVFKPPYYLRGTVITNKNDTNNSAVFCYTSLYNKVLCCKFSVIYSETFTVTIRFHIEKKSCSRRKKFTGVKSCIGYLLSKTDPVGRLYFERKRREREPERERNWSVWDFESIWWGCVCFRNTEKNESVVDTCALGEGPFRPRACLWDGRSSPRFYI